MGRFHVTLVKSRTLLLEKLRVGSTSSYFTATNLVAMSLSSSYAQTLSITERSSFNRNFNSALRGTEPARLDIKQDWEKIKYNNLKFNLPAPEYSTESSRRAHLYLTKGILK